MLIFSIFPTKVKEKLRFWNFEGISWCRALCSFVGFKNWRQDKMNELEGFGLDEIPYVSTYISTCEKSIYDTNRIDLNKGDQY